MYASAGMPFVSLTRSLNVRAVVEARAGTAQAPGWTAIFVKAFALVAKTEPTLRTLHIKWPWPCLYELPRSVGMVAIARVEKGEDCVLFERVCAADEMALTDVDARWDHLVCDAALIARTLARLEQVLSGVIAPELGAIRPESRARPVRAAATRLRGAKTADFGVDSAQIAPRFV